MKTTITTIFLFFSMVSNLYSQIILDHIVDSTNLIYWFRPVQISENETKYYIADTASNTFNLYNMDFTPFMLNIPVPEPFINMTGSTPALFQAIYISRTLFDCDSTNIEFAYEAATDPFQTFYIMR